MKKKVKHNKIESDTYTRSTIWSQTWIVLRWKRLSRERCCLEAVATGGWDDDDGGGGAGGDTSDFISTFSSVSVVATTSDDATGGDDDDDDGKVASLFTSGSVDGCIFSAEDETSTLSSASGTANISMNNLSAIQNNMILLRHLIFMHLFFSLFFLSSLDFSFFSN